jgi:hypothetical protein
VRATWDEARRRRDVDAADLGLSAWAGRTDHLRAAFSRYREKLSALWPQLRRLVDLAVQLVRASARLDTASADRRSRDAREREATLAVVAARSHYLALESAVGSTAGAIVARHAAVVLEHEATKRARTALADEERRSDLERERAEAEIERHTADRGRYEEERQVAIGTLAAFARAGLLAEADGAFAGWDAADEWTPTRGVDVARRAEALLADTPSDDETWRRCQESVHQRVSTLRDQLIPRGHQPEEHVLEDGVVVVQCPFQGQLRTMTDLAATLADDLAARTRLLDEKERAVIENHLLGEVVLELQKLVLDAEKWVSATNVQLADRPTSTGMLLRFQWEGDSDGPDGLDSVRRQLLRTRDLWTPEERRGLAEFLQARIREARDQNEASTWRDVLAAALDSRRWHYFAVERHQDGQWRRLTRRTYGTGSSPARRAAGWGARLAPTSVGKTSFGGEPPEESETPITSRPSEEG